MLDNASVWKLLTITDINATVAIGVLAAVGDISRFRSPHGPNHGENLSSGRLRLSCLGRMGRSSDSRNKLGKNVGDGPSGAASAVK